MYMPLSLFRKVRPVHGQATLSQLSVVHHWKLTRARRNRHPEAIHQRLPRWTP